MPYYESVFIARQEISASQVDALADSFAKVAEDQGGSVTKREYWGLRALAFRIKKNRKGHYVMFNIDGPPPLVQELERQMRINEDVLRYLTIRVDEADPEASIMMQVRSGRGDDRGRREGRPRYDDSRGGPGSHQASGGARSAREDDSQREGRREESQREGRREDSQREGRREEKKEATTDEGVKA